MMEIKAYKLCIYVPSSHTEIVKNALFEQGAGQLGNYQCCSWQVLGEGQFKPSKDANPFIGEADKLEKVQEYRVEMLCQSSVMTAVLKALHQSHPYETPAYEIIPVLDPTVYLTD